MFFLSYNGITFLNIIDLSYFQRENMKGNILR